MKDGKGLINTNCIGTLSYSNGEVYEGEWKNDKRDGKGFIHSKDIGVYNNPDGQKYEGDWKNDKRNGQGNLIKIRYRYVHLPQW